MHILFENNHTIEFTLDESVPVVKPLLQMYKHLQHVDINFKERDSIFERNSLEFNIEKLVKYGDKLNIIIEKEKCNQQTYLNFLHKIYEKNYDGEPEWLDFHEFIHICENNYSSFTRIDYREKSGKLEKPFNQEWLKFGSTYIKKGTIVIAWAELGKTPYQYWQDNEKNDLPRLLELAKPWLILKPILFFAFDDIDLLKDKEQFKFNQWWDNYKDKWCKFWNLSEWTLEQQFSAIPVGNVEDLDAFAYLLKNKIYPKRIKL